MQDRSSGAPAFVSASTENHFDSPSSCAKASINVLYDTPTSFFATNDAPNSWICWDFGNRSVKLASYTIRSSRDPSGWHPKSWVLAVSTDGKSWSAIDERQDNAQLNSPGKTVNFRVTKMVWGNPRYVRLRQTGPNHAGNNVLMLQSVEFFGELWTV